MKLTYGATGQTLTSQFSFWVIPYRLIGLGIIVLVGGFFILRFALGRYKARILKQAHRPRRR